MRVTVFASLMSFASFRLALRVSGVSAAAAAAARAFRTAHDIVTPSRHAHGDEKPSSYGALDSKLNFDPETQVPM
jgi:hypothetical protein